jgi:predicted Zn-dependent protease
MRKSFVWCLFWIPVFAGMTFLFGCETNYNAALHHQETLMYGDDKEINLGASVALSVERQLKINNEVDVNERVQAILKKIVAVCDRKDIIYTIRVVDEDVMNAFSLPGGYIYVYKELVDKMDNDDQLAGVIGHEVAHIVAKHALKRLQAAYGATIIEGAAVFSGQGALAAGVSLGASSLFFVNSREDEFQADRLGVKYMRLAGYDGGQMKFVLAKLLEEANKKGPQPISYWRSHPYISLRIAKVDAEANGALGFKNYLNLTGEDR